MRSLTGQLAPSLSAGICRYSGGCQLIGQSVAGAKRQVHTQVKRTAATFSLWQVKLMKLFLDSAKTDEIKHALTMWDLDGITTNPRHVRDSGKSFSRAIDEIGELVGGTTKPVSVEVNPHLTDWKQIVAEGLALSKRSPNFVVKVGASEGGFKAIRELARQGVRINATLIFSVA